jgi:beta-fructofuranosidase
MDQTENKSKPRVLTLSGDQRSLNIEPPNEVEQLRYSQTEEKPFIVKAGESITLEKVNGNMLEMEITFEPGQAKRFGIKVLCSENGKEQTPVVIDRTKNSLEIDMQKSGINRPVYEEFAMAFASPDPRHNPVFETEDAPFSLNNGEKVHLRIFLDKSVLEVFANGRQCITQVLYPTLNDAVHFQVFADDAPVKVESLKAWKLFPAMQW